MTDLADIADEKHKNNSSGTYNFPERMFFHMDDSPFRILTSTDPHSVDPRDRYQFILEVIYCLNALISFKKKRI